MPSDLAAFASEESSTSDGVGPAAQPLSPATSQLEGFADSTVESGHAFTRSQFRTPLIQLEGSSTSMLFGSGARAVDLSFGWPSVRRSVFEIWREFRQGVDPSIKTTSERFHRSLQALSGLVRGIPTRLQPYAKPLGMAAIGVLAIATLMISGRQLFTTLMSAPKQPVASTQAEQSQARPAGPLPNTTAAPRAPAASPAPTANAAPAANTQADAGSTSLSERASAAVARVLAFVTSSEPQRRTTSIALEPDRARRRTARARTTPAGPERSNPVDTPQVDTSLSAPGSDAGSSLSSPAEAVASPAPVVPEFTAPSTPGRIYSTADTGVIPPVQTYPRYVESLGPNHPNASPFEIVIDENGHVESAVLARYPTTMRQAVSGTMLLAAAKAWRFQPATKDGQPVKFRRLIWFSNQ